MLQSHLFTKAQRSAPKDEQSKNAQILIRAGYVDKLMAGVYSFLPLGLLVLKRIATIIREEINAIGGQELLLPALHPVENYVATGRENIDVLFHSELQGGQKVVFGQSHEEVVVPLVKKFVDSYRDLPLAVYQIQTKFRNELRPKSGIFRGREFIMKDLYSFHADEKDFEEYYERARGAYKNIFDRAGIGEKTLLTFASGGTFSKYSHEYQMLTDSGEDTIYVCEACHIAVNEEIIKDLSGTCPECKKDLSKKGHKAIEVGNIFSLKTRFSDAFGLTYRSVDGSDKPVIMGCYGIGLTRLMGAAAELYSDEAGLRWPSSLAPFQVHIIALSEDAAREAKKLHDALEKRNTRALYDDREGKSAGERFFEADLIGIPTRVVISDKTLQEKKIEVKKRGSDKAEYMDINSFMETV